MKDNSMEGNRLGWRTRVSYAGGDVACNVIFGMVGTLLTLFYTDYVGINPATIGMVMLISRLFDGVSEMGQIKTLDPVDERTVCTVSRPVIYRAAFNCHGAGCLYICDL